MALQKKFIIFGMIGCLCFGIGDWLLGYVDPAPIEGNAPLNMLSDFVQSDGLRCTFLYR